MLSSTYDILGIFDAAFDNAKFVGGILQIDCSGTTRYAEGEQNGVAWRIEADPINRTSGDTEQIKQGYSQMGENLLIHFYAVAKEKAQQLGWSGSDIDRIAETALTPVLSAMRFHMEMASDRGWLDASIGMTHNMDIQTRPAAFTLAQAFKWSKLDGSKQWSSMELMSMLIGLESYGHCLTEAMGQVWIKAHTPAHRQAAKGILNIPFAMDDSVNRSNVYNSEGAALTWKTWWLQVPFAHIGETPLSKLEKVNESTRLEIVGGWYLAVAKSKKKSQCAMAGMEHFCHELPNANDWSIFSSTLCRVVKAYPSVVWQDRDSQAWMLHKCMPFDTLLSNHVAMQKNAAHDYIVIRTTLDTTCKPHECYSHWLQLKANGIEMAVDAGELFEHDI